LSGLYIHIPFCRKACHYCDFHFSTLLKYKSELVNAICKEIDLRAQQSDNQSKAIETIYLGGGTPSLLTEEELERILKVIHRQFVISSTAEITLEANPEDILKDKLSAWRSFGVNRLSIGIQSFDDKILKSINRAHNANQAKKALEDSIAIGYDNITADLIFGIPPFTIKEWESELDQLLHFNIPHISIYGLTIEPNTVYGKWLKQGSLNETDEKRMEEAFRLTHHKLEKEGLIHYEVSNYARPGQESKHNSAYWKGKPYLGFGPGAHSYDGIKRSFNVSNNSKYMKEIAKDVIPSTLETLTEIDQVNEFLFTRLRTIEGINLDEYQHKFKRDLLKDFPLQLNNLIEQQFLSLKKNNLKLTLNGMLLADEISLKLFYE
jgi:oxygen-independent coproporphyrinogen-3 oxidase